MILIPGGIHARRLALQVFAQKSTQSNLPLQRPMPKFTIRSLPASEFRLCIANLASHPAPSQRDCTLNIEIPGIGLFHFYLKWLCDGTR